MRPAKAPPQVKYQIRKAQPEGNKGVRGGQGYEGDRLTGGKFFCLNLDPAVAYVFKAL
jgi:hypothetical protein